MSEVGAPEPRVNGEGEALRRRQLARVAPSAREEGTDGTPLEQMLQVLRRRWLLVVFTALAVPLAALGFSLSQTEEYTAESSLLFRDAGVDQQLFGSAFFSESSDPEREAATNIRLVSLDGVANRTAAALPALRLSGSEVSGKIDVSEEGDSDIATIAATDEDPAVASRLANTFAREFIEFRRQADRSTIQRAQRLVQAQLDRLPPEETESSEAAQLRQREQELRILASLQTGDVELVQRAKPPSSPSSPKTQRNVALGLVLGLLLGIAVALLREQLDRRLRNPEEAQRAYDLPLLAVIPKTGTMVGNQAFSLHRVPSASTEAFRMLRANLRFFNVDQTVGSVLVTSAAPREGKTTVSWNLALAEAQSGKSVLLIEADLRHPTLAQSYAVESDGALTLLLAGDQSLDKAITPVAPRC
jgi:succinoglycan biosynthesis transport protein ExoP